MARQVNGHLGTFNTLADLTAKFPPAESIGCSANVGTTIPYTKAWCNGIEWALVNAPAIQTLVSADGKTIAVAMGILGQSLPFGATLAPDAEGVAQKAHFSASTQNYFEPDPLAPGASGSYLVPAIQQLGAEGIKVFMTNTALGGISLIYDVCGVIDITNGVSGGWRANRAYRGRRTTLGTGDPGTKGEFILESGRVWEATTGCTHLAFYNSDTPVTVGGFVWRRNLVSIAKNVDRTSATAKPTFSAAAAVNDTVTDNGAGALGGGIVWTCVAIASPAADASGVRVARTADLYWDPYGFQLRARNAIVGQPVPAANRYCLVVGTVQSDAGASQTLVRLSHQLTNSYMLADGVKTIHTSCLFNPASTQANYDSYETVLSGSGLGVDEDYANSLLTVALNGASLVRGIPGTTPRASAHYYYMRSAYRHFGTDVVGMLQTPQPNPHPTPAGAVMIGMAHVPALRAIFRNVAA